jgi:hypothetical protein
MLILAPILSDRDRFGEPEKSQAEEGTYDFHGNHA